MPDAREDARAQYAKTRSEFEKLDPQDKTVFVVEATFAAIGQAVEQTGRQVADVLERVATFDFGSWREPGSEPDEDAADRPNPAEPPTSARRTPPRPPKPPAASDDED